MNWQQGPQALSSFCSLDSGQGQAFGGQHRGPDPGTSPDSAEAPASSRSLGEMGAKAWGTGSGSDSSSSLSAVWSREPGSPCIWAYRLAAAST